MNVCLNIIVYFTFTLIAYGASLPLASDVTAEPLQYRLPDDVIPLNYQIDLKLEEDAFETNTFSGNVSISIQVLKPVQEIRFHSKNITVSKIEIVNNDKQIDIETVNYDSETNQMDIWTSAELLPTEIYVLTISYEGILSDTLMRGFYKSVYEEDGVVNYLATTQFEPTYARQAFPCFDEPGFKATFDISVTFPKDFNALGNTVIASLEDAGGNLQKATFQTTPKMSTYLVAFIVSKFTCAEGDTIDQIPTSVCSRTGAQNTTKLAVSVGPKVLKVMEGYTGYAYANSEITKLTQVAIPDFELGAMENWGLITFRESDLLWDEEDSSNAYQERVASVVAHELSHQWFGDLVTLNWWSNIFLNEGFARYFQYHVTDQIYPDWQYTKEFVLVEVQGSLLVDGSQTTLPLSYDVEVPEKIQARFDTISYNKGASVLRMVHHFLGIENFIAALTDYIAENKFQNTNPTILWNSFEKYAEDLVESVKLPATMVEVMENWTNKSGYPLLTVSANGDDIIISQEQFLYSGSSDVEWYVPISFSGPNGDFTDTLAKAWLVPSEKLTIPDILSDESPWVVLNNQQTGFYRVNYDDELWKKISESLQKPDFDGIDILSRSQIVDDLLNLARANKKSYSQTLDLLSFLKNDDGYYPWYSAFNGFGYILKRIGHKNLVTSFQDYISNLMAKLYTSTPFTDEKPDDHIYTRKQVLALTWACKLNNEDCVTYSKDIFADYRDQSIKPSRNLRTVVYCSGLRNSDSPSEDFNFLWSQYNLAQISTEKETILHSLGCVTNTDTLKDYIQKTITEGSGIRRQDARHVFSSVYENSAEGLEIALEFALNNYHEITAYFGSTTTVNSLISSVADRFTNQEQIDKLVNFIDNGELDDNSKTAINETIKIAQANLEVTEALEAQLESYFSKQ